MLTDILTIWSDSAALSLAIWLVIIIALLYAGRSHAHHLLESTGRVIYRALRLASASVRQLESRLETRNRDVLLAQGREHTEKAIEREFSRVNSIVERNLHQYPALHRKLADSLQKIEEDYYQAVDETPLPPAWSEMVETISSLPTTGDPAVTKILDNIQEAVENAHQQTLKAYQKNCRERQRILSAMQPEWHSLNTTMKQVQQTVTGLEERSKVIDRHMADYESMRQGEDKAVNTLTASSFTQFFIASLVLTIAVFGGIINFHLIALPMSEMVGGASYIGDVRTSDIAALVIIMVEITMGLFLLEALQITRLFPLIGSLDDRMRKFMAVAAFVILVIFASIEASLAYMRDLLALDREALQQSLAGTAVAEAEFRWIPSVGQLVLGFILPFALAFVGIPLESFIHSLRTVVGLIALWCLRTLRLGLRLAGGIAHHLSQVLVSLYDLFIMIPLAIERAVNSWREKATSQSKTSQEELAPWEEEDYEVTDEEEITAIQETARQTSRSAGKQSRSNKDSSPTPTLTPQEA